MNVAVNARDAMPDGGKLSIEISRADFPDRSGRYGIRISLRDTGSGVPEEALPHVFEPFFTTKEVGKGTGLGLSQVYGFARASGGLADITSKAGRGTTISLYLPEVATSAASSVAPGPASGIVAGRGQRCRGFGRVVAPRLGLQLFPASAGKERLTSSCLLALLGTPGRPCSTAWPLTH